MRKRITKAIRMLFMKRKREGLKRKAHRPVLIRRAEDLKRKARPDRGTPKKQFRKG